MAQIEVDCIDGLNHPRETFEFIGNYDAEMQLYNALQSKKLHHAWIFHGAKGIGKATLAYRFARRYLGAKASDESPLASVFDDNICAKIASNSMPDLRVATRFCPDDLKIKRDVGVAAIRNLTQMFDLKASNIYGRRVAIIDCVDDMRQAGANALLKTLEEPPIGAIIILIANSMGAILPTIRSRCSILHLKPCDDGLMHKAIPNISPAALALSKGCVGRAKALEKYDADGLYNYLANALNGFPHSPLSAALKLSEKAKENDDFEIIHDLIIDWLDRAIKAGLGLDICEIEPGESAALARLTKNKDFEKLTLAYKKIQALKHNVANNLDRPSAILESINIIKQALV